MGPLRDFLSGEARGQLMLMLSTTPMAMAWLVLLVTQLAPPMLPGLPRVSEARGLLMLKLKLMLTTMEDMDIPMLTVDMDIPLHTEDMDMRVLDMVIAVDTIMVKLLCCYLCNVDKYKLLIF